MAAPSKKSSRRRKRTVQRKPVDCPSYVRLRAVLDSLEVLAIRYYIGGNTPSGMKAREAAIEKQLLPIIQWLSGNGLEACPSDLIPCDGLCLPYPCISLVAEAALEV